MPAGKFAVDLTGQRFGRLLVKHRGPNDHRGHSMWRCLCDCGNFVEARASSLRRGASQSCGCLNRFIVNEARRPSSGQKYGLLTVLEYAGVRKGKSYFVCECECGSIIETRSTSLRTGKAKSCGCLRGCTPSPNEALFRQIDQMVSKPVDICIPTG